MDNNANESGSRVTRSLRKRLTSVDSDNSSRPGTPVPSKLTAISEMSTASPSRSTRMTRRNSTTGVATPVKTPAKRGASSSTTIAEITETVTPARRSTRRRSVSVFENDENNTSVLKTPAFAALNEETTTVEQITTRVTRSQSKSPQQNKLAKTSPSPKQTKRSSVSNTNIESRIERNETPPSTEKRRKIGPKSKTRENKNQQGDSEVEISVLSNEMENIKYKSNNIPTIILTDDESNQTAQMIDEDKTHQYSETLNTITVVDPPTIVLTGKESNQFPQNKLNKSNNFSTIVLTDEKSNQTVQINIDEEKTPQENETLNTVKVVDHPMIVLTEKESNQLPEKKLDTDKTPQRNEIKTVVDPEHDVVADNNVLNENEMLTDNNYTNVEDPEKADVNVSNSDVLNKTKDDTNMDVAANECPELSLKNLESEPTTEDPAKADVNVSNSDVLDKTKDDTNMDVTEMECPEQLSLKILESEPTTVSELRVAENTNELSTTEPNKRRNENEENCNMESDDQNSHTNTDVASKENILFDDKIDKNEEVESTTLYVTQTEKEFKNKESTIEKYIYGSECLKVDDNDVITNNTLNTQESSDVNSEEKGGTKSILETSQTKQKSSSDKIEILSVSTLTPYRKCAVEDSNGSESKLSSKKVDFISSPSNDMTIKNVFPKTPASARISNSFIEINSSPEDGSFHTEIKQELEHNYVESSVQVEQKMTPVRAFKVKRSLETVQSSTPINAEELKTKTESEQGVQEELLKDDTTNKMEIKWINPSVKGTGEGSKLDVVTSTCDISENNESVDQQVQRHKKKSIIFSSEDEEEDDEHLERENGDYEDDEELAPGEEPYKRKHDFHDDEAMEVDNYESGDSMDSEERREIEENEIPIDGESIGSHTTEDDQDGSVEEEESDNADSFIVSDNEEVLQFSDSNEENNLMEEVDNNERNKNKKKTYKRVQRPADSSSSSEEEEKSGEDEEMKRTRADNNDDKPLDCPKESPISQPEAIEVREVKTDLESLNKSSENMLDSSKLSDSALRLQCTAQSDSEAEEINIENEKIMNISRKEILRKLNQSDRFNKSVRDLNPEIDMSPVENFENESNQMETASDQQDEKLTLASSEDCIYNKLKNCKKEEHYESHLGEVSATSESDGDKENQHKSLRIPKMHKLQSGLSVSFGSYKKPKNISKGRQEWQRSFTIDVSVKDDDLITEVTDIKQCEEDSTSSDTSTTSTDERENVGLQSEDIQYLENIRHMPLPLGNPLIRTRRQSLALPTNPDMEICSSNNASGITCKKTKRKSLGVLSNSEFNPSQSFIDSIELQKSELVQQIGKRKRLSKSFCGASDSLDNSIIDIDVRHMHKRSKLLGENSIVESHHDSIENINSSKLSTKYSSTPHQKKTNENDSNNNIQHILNRCDEILEAANRAKLEAKLNNKKHKGKISKKLRKKYALTSTSDGTNSDDALRRVSIEIKRKDKIKSVVSQALRAGNAILSNKKQNFQQIPKKEENENESKKLPPEVLRAIEEESSTKKRNKRDNDKKKPISTTSTSAGNFVELPQTPEKKKKKTFIQLPTGKVCVEPVTPQKRSVQALNGAEFRESPITPYAVGFKVRQIPKLENISSSGVLRNEKRKRHHYEAPKERSLKKPLWTQSGLFLEEEIPKNRNLKKKHPMEIDQVNRNFKENALMRPEVKRGNKREILLLKERRQMQSGHF